MRPQSNRSKILRLRQARAVVGFDVSWLGPGGGPGSGRSFGIQDPFER